MKTSTTIRKELANDEEITSLANDIAKQWGVTIVFGIPPKTAILDMIMTEVCASYATKTEDFINPEFNEEIMNRQNFKELVLSKLKEEKERI